MTTEVRNDHTDDQNYTYIDVWDESEQGNTVAIVCLDTGKVFYIDSKYRYDEAVKEAIQEVLEGIKKIGGNEYKTWRQLQEYRSNQASVIESATKTINESSNKIRTLCLKKKDLVDSLDIVKRQLKRMDSFDVSKFKEVVNKKKVIKSVETQIKELHDDLLFNVEAYNNILRVFNETVS